MLALPIFVPVVPTSANLLFLFTVNVEGEVESKEWEGVRDFVPAGLGPLAASGEGALSLATAVKLLSGS